jgi:transaldolase
MMGNDCTRQDEKAGVTQGRRNSSAILEQALHFDGLAPNIQVKIPATEAGMAAIEETAYRGVNINATVCFTVPQAIAVAEPVERGLARRASEGHSTTRMAPVCTIMIGQLDDWMKVVAQKESVVITPGHLDCAGIPVIKRAYEILQRRRYRARVLAVAYRHRIHWSELIGGDLSMTIQFSWQLLFNHSDIKVKERMQNPVDPQIVDELCRKFPEFRKAFDPDGVSVEEFDSYGATVRTLRKFIASYAELLAFVRDFMLPHPDKNRQQGTDKQVSAG